MRDGPSSCEDRVADLFHAKAEWHRGQARLPVKEKVRILLELQRQAGATAQGGTR